MTTSKSPSHVFLDKYITLLDQLRAARDDCYDAILRVRTDNDDISESMQKLSALDSKIASLEKEIGDFIQKYDISIDD